MKSMVQSAVWKEAMRQAVSPERVKRGLERLEPNASATLRKPTAELARLVAALFSGSQAMGEILVKHPEWLQSEDAYRHARRDQGLRDEVRGGFDAALEAQEYEGALARLREFKQREMLRLAIRDLGRLGHPAQITRELSSVADVCLSAVYRLCFQRLSNRLGRPYHRTADGDWEATEFAVIGLGKLGGQELNYSSDVDLIFVYTEEGFVFEQPPGKKVREGGGMTSHQFYKRLGEALVSELTRQTTEGSLFRVDLRLRPEGDTGPIVRSVPSYENYYASWGQPWERMMLIKARCVAGDCELGGEFIESIHPFRYPRSLGTTVLSEVALLKRRIEQEVVRAGELDRNVKLGHGGIREIEFVAQTLQLVHGGRNPFLQGGQTVPVLDKLSQYRLLPETDVAVLKEAYWFLRDVEHRLQMEEDRQTHTVPVDRRARERLGKLMGFPTLSRFNAALRKQMKGVRRVYGKLLKPETAGVSALPAQIDDDCADQWKAILREHGFRDADQSFRMLREFLQGPGYMHVSVRTRQVARQLLPRFLSLCRTTGEKRLSDPDRVMARIDSFVSAYGARATLFETWHSNPSLFDLLLLLFDRSEFLAETAIRTPDLVDELVLSGRLVRRKAAGEILEDLRYGLKEKDQGAWIRRYHQTERMRIGLRDILGLADCEQNFLELSALADACLQYALEAVLRKRRLKRAPLTVIALGKLGGQELNYGSDLDIVFVGAEGKKLSSLSGIAVELMDLLSKPTELGSAFETDARLRPDGEAGLLVNTLGAYEAYYRDRAQLWEVQALSRARAVAGNAKLGEEFEAMVARMTDLRGPDVPVAAGKGPWMEEIARMRDRIEKERTPPGKDPLAIKTGRGGLIDAEFVAQALCLAHGWREPNTLKALRHAQEAKVLPGGKRLIEAYRKLHRVEAILRRWSYEGESLLPEDPAPQLRVAVRCGWTDAESFLDEVGRWRREIRKGYDKVFSKGV